MTSVTIIIPAYNEEKRIASTLISYASYFPDHEILVEMDGCTDGTGEIVRRLEKEYSNIRHIEFREKLGKGAGVVRGIIAAKGDIVGFADADGSVSPSDFSQLLSAVASGADCAIASRRLKSSSVNGQPFMRKFLGSGFNLLVRLMFRLPYKDTQCGGKAGRGDILREAAKEIRVSDFAFDINLLYLIKRSGYAVEEIPVSWTACRDSKVSLSRTPVKMLASLLWLRLFFSPFQPILHQKPSPVTH